MKIKRFIGGVLESNGYVIYQQDDGECFIIDPGYNSRVFHEFVEQHSLKPKGILLTHHHYDHVGAVNKLKDIYGCPVYIHRRDVDMYKGYADIYMEDGDILKLEEEEIQVINTPGHTRGSVCYLSLKSKVAFTGDTVFDTDIGRIDLEDGSEMEMVDSILNKINKWPNDIVIYPGHGDGCSMKKVKEHNEEFLYVLNNYK